MRQKKKQSLKQFAVLVYRDVNQFGSRDSAIKLQAMLMPTRKVLNWFAVVKFKK